MLSCLMDGWFKFDPALGGIYAIIGFVFVFVGIGILIAVLNFLGFIMKKNDEKKAKAQEKKAQSPVPAQPQVAAEESVPDEVKAAIVAAIMAYYTAEKPKCEFVVKKIKRI